MKKGDRVKVSALAIERGLFRYTPRDRLGTVNRTVGQGTTAYVLWDGRTTPERVASIFVEVVPAEKSNEEHRRGTEGAT